jgi:signal transduction histidine kinase
VAALGSAYHSDGGTLARWLVVAMMLLAGSQLYNALWPSAYSPVLTIADLLRVGFASVLSVGGIIELRRVAAERMALLAAEQEQSRRLVELAVLKADFTAMVAHELANPLAAIRGYAEMMATRSLSPEDQATALATIRSESNTLISLINDIRIAATVERDDFAVRMAPVPVGVLLADAAAFGRSLPGDHPITISSDTHVLVMADQERIGQVLRNLLSNAASFSADGTPIKITATNQATRVRISVIDHGIGITPRDMVRIFEKFGRGRDQSGKKVPGAGLGLYLSRRIVQAHGTELTVESTPGVGSVFSFEVEAAR